jgi:hypothetical protein
MLQGPWGALSVVADYIPSCCAELAAAESSARFSFENQLLSTDSYLADGFMPDDRLSNFHN